MLLIYLSNTVFLLLTVTKVQTFFLEILRISIFYKKLLYFCSIMFNVRKLKV